MCFTLYIAAQVPLPIVPWDRNNRALNTQPLDEHDVGVRRHFQLDHVCYLGSDINCGCGFRHATYQNGSWPEEEWRPDDDTRPQEAQPNHVALVDFVRRHLGGQTSFELYGVWDGEVNEPAASNQTIALGRLLDLDFFFRERGHYTVRIAPPRLTWSQRVWHRLVGHRRPRR